MAKINERKVENKRKPLKRNDLIAEKEKIKMQHKYNKMMRKEAKTSSNPMRPSQRVQTNKRKSFDRSNKVEEQTTKYKTVNQRAKELYEEKQQEKQRVKEEEERKEAEKKNAIQKYKNNKKDKFKKLCKKTKNGQILMGKQMDTLLTKIQKNKNNF